MGTIFARQGLLIHAPTHFRKAFHELLADRTPAFRRIVPMGTAAQEQNKG